jgi:8-oxo-dGTP pyrophosphatase MutT (NUDIX family)
VQWTVAVADHEWLVQWLPQDTSPAGRNHGSSAVCFSRNGVVLVSRDRKRWEFPAGRPEADESLLDTLRREVREEACCEVETAYLLGFTVSTCLDGHERDVVLVRAHWAARVTAMPWRPVHEVVERAVVPLDDVMSTLTIEPGLEPAYQAIWKQARQALVRAD